MRSKREAHFLVCDACDYALTRDSTEIDGKKIIELKIPWRLDGGDLGYLTFHFHAPILEPISAYLDAYDCLRSFITTPRYVTRALERRGMTDPEEVDRFLAQISYREEKK